MLGTEVTCWDTFINYTSYPKFMTSHYNVNGMNTFRSKWTIIAFICMVGYICWIFFYQCIPLFLGLTQLRFDSTVVETWNLGNNLNLKSNATWNG